ncbi:MAG: metal-dependent hydrolase [Candidatus Malihini olakiniferum]
MTAEGHLLFSVACAIFAKNVEISQALARGDWWHIIPGAMLAALLPDIDHPKSVLGQRLKWISAPISRVFGHRGFTHSLLCVAIICFIRFQLPADWPMPTDDAYHAMLIGYLSHLMADMLTSAGVPLLWPYRWRFRLPLIKSQKGNQFERVVCLLLIVFSLYHSPRFGTCYGYEQACHWYDIARNQFMHLLRSLLSP